jgi:aldose 1-epimerase
MRVTNYGAIVLSLEAPDRNGKNADIVLGYKTLAEYEKATPYFGAIVGRYGNRIANGRFSLDGREYKLATNNTPGGKPCALHGGLIGFDKVVWRAEGVSKEGAQGVKLRYLSKDGEEGYPGNLDLQVT